ncbi:hypothetical protein PV325_001274 [Microctonus aethiopoides]|nr:hypothetical protein PV325_001274 [Microctonus aethiopoides]
MIELKNKNVDLTARKMPCGASQAIFLKLFQVQPIKRGAGDVKLFERRSRSYNETTQLLSFTTSCNLDIYDEYHTVVTATAHSFILLSPRVTPHSSYSTKESYSFL